MFKRLPKDLCEGVLIALLSVSLALFLDAAVRIMKILLA